MKPSTISNNGDAKEVRSGAKGIALSLANSIAMLVFALCGLFASSKLVLSELQVLSDPSGSLGCDLNPLIGCSSSLMTKQAHLLGPPNALFGIMAFAALAAFAVVLVSGNKLPTWLWWAMGFGSIVGVGYVLFFLTQSLTFFRTLCPYCMVVWAATLAIFVIVWGALIAAGKVGSGAKAVGRLVLRFSGLLILAVYLIFVLVIILALPDKIAALF